MKPLMRGHLHQAMFFVLLGACIPLFLRCSTVPQKVSIGIYSACALVMFGISALYHRINWSVQSRQTWKKLDHAGIYLMIAGTFTPVAMLGLSPNDGNKLLITIWAVAAFGIIQSIFFVNIPKPVSAVLYLAAGYVIFPFLHELRGSIGEMNIILLVSGGAAYTIGALCYGFRLLDFRPEIFGYHEAFHLFVNIGAACHFAVIHSLVITG